MPKKRELTRFLNIFIEINILVMLFCLPFSKSIIEICASLMIVAFAVKKIFIERGFNLRLNKRVIGALFIFAVANILSLINSEFFVLSFTSIFSKVFEGILLFIIIADTLSTSAQFKRVLVVMMCSCILILADAFYQQYVTGLDFLHYPNRYPVFKFHDRGKEDTTTFPTASFPYPNDFAAWINVFLFVFLFLSIFDLRDNKFKKITAAGLSGLLLFFLFLTTSRGHLSGQRYPRYA